MNFSVFNKDVLSFPLDLFTSITSMACFHHCLKSSIHKMKMLSQQKTFLQFLVFVLFCFVLNPEIPGVT